MSPRSNYNFIRPKVIAVGAKLTGFSTSQYEVANVRSAFDRVSTKGEYLAIQTLGMIPPGDYVYYDTKALFQKFSNHFQGINRLSGRNVIVLSGCNSETKQSLLFIARLSSRLRHGAWRSNLLDGDRASRNDNISLVIHLNDGSAFCNRHGITSAHWHAGGMSVLGDLLAVPLESRDLKHGSRVLFFNMANPTKPKLFDFVIKRPGLKAGLVGLNRLPSGHYLAAILHNPPGGKEAIDFYISNSHRIQDGFALATYSWQTRHLKTQKGQKKHKLKGYQNLSLIVDRKNNLYMIGTHNTAGPSPLVPGKDYADLFHIKLTGKGSKAKNVLEFAIESVTKTANKHMYCHHCQCNMDAGASVYVDKSGELMFYSCYHWVRDFQLRFNEFRPHSKDIAKNEITDPDEAWIDMYEDDRLRGKRMSLIGRRNSTFADYENVRIRGDSFNDKVSSIQYQIPRGYTYKLYEHAMFRGKVFPLKGNGACETINDLKENGFGDRVSSSRYA